MTASKPLLAITLVLALLIGPLVLRSSYEGQRHLYQGEAYLAQGHTAEAIAEFGKSVTWNSPVDDSAKLAGQRLHAIGFDKSIPADIRLQALETHLRGLQSSRHFLRPEQLSLESPRTGDIVREIDSLTTRTEAQPKISLAQRPSVRFFDQILALAAFFAWTASAAWTIARGFTREGKILPSPMLKGLGMTLLCYLAWLGALAL